MSFINHITSRWSTAQTGDSTDKDERTSYRGNMRDQTNPRVHAAQAALSNETSARSVIAGPAVITLNKEPVNGHSGSYEPPNAAQASFFLGRLAPSLTAAVACLDTQPTTAVMLVWHADELVVAVKFRRGVRFQVLITHRETRKRWREIVVDWGYPSSIATAPMHRIHLPVDLYQRVDKCWTTFVPHVQEIISDLCSSATYHERTENNVNNRFAWNEAIASFSGPCAAFLATETMGFYFFDTRPAGNAQVHRVSGTGNDVVRARFIEFDCQQCVIFLADGGVRPGTALSTVTTQLGPKRGYPPVLGLDAIRDNFLYPERITLKETRVDSSPNGSRGNSFSLSFGQSYGRTSSATGPTLVSKRWQDLSTDLFDAPGTAHRDTELGLLRAAHTLCNAMTPNEPLPSDWLHAVHELHSFWAAERDRSTKQAPWTLEKTCLVASTLPYYVEVFLSVATTAAPLPRIASALQADILEMVQRCHRGKGDDDGQASMRNVVLGRFVHQLLQAFILRDQMPLEFVQLIRVLCKLVPAFRVRFLRQRGPFLLWRAYHTASIPVPPMPMLKNRRSSRRMSISPVVPLTLPPTSSISSIADIKRRSSLFTRSLGRRASAQQSDDVLPPVVSMDFAIFLARPPDTHSRSSTFFLRVNPLVLQHKLSAQMKDRYFAPLAKSPHMVEESGAQALLLLVFDVARYLLTIPVTSLPSWNCHVESLLAMDELYPRLSKAMISQTSNLGALKGTVACISACYWLEIRLLKSSTLMRERRRDKRYWHLFHNVRTWLRDINKVLEQRLISTATTENRTNDNPQLPVNDTKRHPHTPCALTGESEPEGRIKSVGEAINSLRVLACLFPLLPGPMLAELVLMVLEDFVQTVQLAGELEQQLSGGNYEENSRILADCVLQCVTILTVILIRTHDLDLQMLLLQVVAAPDLRLPALLQRLASPSSEVDRRSKNERCVVDCVVSLADLAQAHTRLEGWSRRHQGVRRSHEIRNDAEALERRKTMLMTSMLTPKHYDVPTKSRSVWTDCLDLVLLPPSQPIDQPSTESSSLWMAKEFYTNLTEMKPALLDDDRQEDAMMEKAYYLRARAQLYVSPIMDDVTVDPHLSEWVLRHWECLEYLRNEYATLVERDKQEERESHRSTIAVATGHLECLMALTARPRSASPSIFDAFEKLEVAQHLLYTLRDSGMDARHSNGEAPWSSSLPSLSTSSSRQPLLTLKRLISGPDSYDGEHLEQVGHHTVPALSFNLDRISLPVLPSMTSPVPCYSISTSTSGSTTTATNLLLQDSMLHAASVVLIICCLVTDTNALDSKLSPRYFIPSDNDAHATNDNDNERWRRAIAEQELLWHLQQHLCIANPRLIAEIGSWLQYGELRGLFGNTQRADSIRTLTRLLLPDSFMFSLYGAVGGGNSDGDPGSSALPAGQFSERNHRTYLAKGAFATVYHAQVALHDEPSVAIKVLAHQRKLGELCVIGDLFNEVSVLQRLRSNPSATQLLDFGNHSQAESFELVMEHCPSTLSEWRAALGGDIASRESQPVPVKTLLCMVLIVVREVAGCLTQIHADRVCHFDVKADNVLLRIDQATFTARLGKCLAANTLDSTAVAVAIENMVCLADFGESVIIPDGVHATDGVMLTRTRGTEAIKSPEMIRFKGDSSGSDAASSPIGTASDVWSLGCLLYELVTQELLFGSDDWAQLYAHVVMSETGIIRDDHRQKLLHVFQRDSDHEQVHRAVDFVTELLEQILVRDVQARPSLEYVLDKIDGVLAKLLALPNTTTDVNWLAAMTGEPSPARGLNTSLDNESATILSPLVCRGGNHDSTSCDMGLARVFWNLYVGREVSELLHRLRNSLLGRGRLETTHLTQHKGEVPLPTVQHEQHEIERLLEPEFSHFIYFQLFDCPDEPTGPTCFDSDQDHTTTFPSDRVAIEENTGYTVIRVASTQLHSSLCDPATVPSSPIISLLTRSAQTLLPVFQYCLQHEPMRVICVPVISGPTDSEDNRKLHTFMTLTLLYVLITNYDLSPFQAISLYTRDGAQVTGLPSLELLHQLQTYHIARHRLRRSVEETERDVHDRCIASRCRCGHVILAVARPILNEAEHIQAPGPAVDGDAPLHVDEGRQEVADSVVHDLGDARLVYSHKHTRRSWRVVELRHIDRLASQLDDSPHDLVEAASCSSLGFRPGQQHGDPGMHFSGRSSLCQYEIPDGASSFTHSGYSPGDGLEECVRPWMNGLRERRTETVRCFTVSLECALCGSSVCAVDKARDQAALPPHQANENCLEPYVASTFF